MTLLLAVLLSLAPAADTAPAPTDPAGAEHKELEAVLVRTEAVDTNALRAALKLRVPGTQIAELSEVNELPGDAPFVFADIKTRGDGAFELTLVVSDGRAYDRVVVPDEGATPTETADRLARDIANIILGIEEGSLPPDRSDVPIPEPPAVKEDPAEPPPVVKEPSPPPASLRPPPPRVELGLRVAPSIVVGFGDPADVHRLVAGGSTLGLAARLLGGAVVFAEARLAGRTHDNGGLLRTRIAVGGGYAWRSNRDTPFELEGAAAITVEPWLVFADGSRASLGRSSVPAVGGFVRLVPGYRWVKSDESLGVRVGPFVEYALSALPGSGGAVAKVSSPADDGLEPMFRLGGSELGVGIDALLYFGAPRRRQTNVP